MTRRNFRLLLIGYVLLVAIDLATGSITDSTIPTTVLEAQRTALHGRFFSHGISALTVFVVCEVIAMILAAVVGLIGMFFCWRPAPYIFFAAVIARNFAYPLMWPWHAEAGWEGFVGSFGIALEGVIFAIVFFGPAKSLFFSGGSPTTQSSELPSAGAAGSRSP